MILDQQRGIAAIIDKRDGQNLIREDAVYPAFTGIYEVTDMQGQACESRRRMGRNRKDVSTARYASTLKDIRIVENGPVYTAVQLDYRLHGTGFYSVFLKVYKAAARLEAMVRIHKDSVWEPENLYISLPFTAGEEEVKYIDSTPSIALYSSSYCFFKASIFVFPASISSLVRIWNFICCRTVL